MTTSNEGLLKIYFSEQFIIPSKFNININTTVLDVKLISKSGVDPKFQKFNWTTMDYNN